MRLLPKEEISRQKAQEQKQTIDEAVKLAKRVDSLRELAAVEQTRLVKYRDASLEEIQKKLIEEGDKLQNLQVQVQQESRKLEFLQHPLEKERERIEASKAELEKRSQSFEEEQKHFQAAFALNLRREREAKLELGRAEDFKRQAAKELSQAEAALKKARQDSDAIREKALRLMEEADLKKIDSLQREEEVAIRERDAENKARAAEIYAEKLFLKEQELKDRWKVLMETEGLLRKEK